MVKFTNRTDIRTKHAVSQSHYEAYWPPVAAAGGGDGGDGDLITANMAAKQMSGVKIAPVDIFKDTCRVFF